MAAAVMHSGIKSTLPFCVSELTSVVFLHTGGIHGAIFSALKKRSPPVMREAVMTLLVTLSVDQPGWLDRCSILGRGLKYSI